MGTSGGLHLIFWRVLKPIWCFEPLDIDEFQWMAIIDIIFTLGSAEEDNYRGRLEQWKRRREQWKKVRWQKFKTQSESLWLCSQHASQFVPAQLHVESSLTLDRDDFLPKDVAKTCRHYRQDGSLCEGSKMSLEVPDSGTRLELEYVAPRVNLTLWFHKRASGGT